MPSNEYFAEFRRDRFLCRIVAWSGGVLAGAGLVSCMCLALPPGGRLAAGLAWCGIAGAELLALQRASRFCSGFRIMADGSAAVRGDDGQWQPAALIAGGVLLRRYGWLRLRTLAGRVIAQPVRGTAGDGRDWRRLHVIWRHVGAVR